MKFWGLRREFAFTEIHFSRKHQRELLRMAARTPGVKKRLFNTFVKTILLFIAAFAAMIAVSILIALDMGRNIHWLFYYLPAVGYVLLLSGFIALSIRSRRRITRPYLVNALRWRRVDICTHCFRRIRRSDANAEHCSYCGKDQMPLFCPRCTYDLSGHEQSFKRCPECGEERRSLPIARVMHEKKYQDHDSTTD